VIETLSLDEVTSTDKAAAIHIKVKKSSRADVEKAFLDSVFKTYDVDSNGNLDFDEFCSLCEMLKSPMSEIELKKIFNGADKNNSGRLNRNEVSSIIMSKQFQNEDMGRKLLLAMRKGTEAVTSLAMTDVIEPASVYEPPKDGEAFSGDRILVLDRESGMLVNENIPGYIKTGMRMFYRSSNPSSAMTAIFNKMTVNKGAEMNDPKSASQIDKFIETHQLNINEVKLKKTDFKNFNEFFYRELTASARVCASPNDPSVAVSPADSRLTVFPTIAEAQRLWIKGENFSLENLFAGWDSTGAYAKEFRGGSLVIARLAPQDYHRWHVPVSGKQEKRFLIEGDYYTVNPIAIRRNVDVYTRNKRVICPIMTKEFGRVLVIAVGATMVGSINFVDSADKKETDPRKLIEDESIVGKEIKKFDQHGYFAFGGSTTLVLFKPGTIVFDEDLMHNSARQLETLVKVGSRLGVATSAAHSSSSSSSSTTTTTSEQKST